MKAGRAVSPLGGPSGSVLSSAPSFDTATPALWKLTMCLKESSFPLDTPACSPCDWVSLPRRAGFRRQGCVRSFTPGDRDMSRIDETPHRNPASIDAPPDLIAEAR